MTQTTAKIIAILKCYVTDPRLAIGCNTALTDLEIDDMDVPMISLDIEDAFSVQIPYDEDGGSFATVQSLAASVDALLEAKAKQPSPRPRIKSTWMSTGAERRR